MRLCCTCKNLKEENLFSSDRSRKDKISPRCKECDSKKNKDLKEMYTERYRTNPEYRNKVRKSSIASYYRSTKKKCTDCDVRISPNAKNIRCRACSYKAKRVPESQRRNALIARSLRQRIRDAMKNHSTRVSATRNLGCDIDFFRKHLESKWQTGMSWGNYGYHGWHIDHIKPLSKFDLLNPKEYSIALHYTNMQPLWREDNQRKSAKII